MFQFIGKLTGDLHRCAASIHRLPSLIHSGIRVGIRNSDDRDIYAVVAADDGMENVEIIDEKAKESQAWRQFSKSFPGQFVYPISYSRDGSMALYSVRSPTNSGEYCLFNTASGKSNFLFARDTCKSGQPAPEESLVGLSYCRATELRTPLVATLGWSFLGPWPPKLA